jgi:hypothetical protein
MAAIPKDRADTAEAKVDSELVGEKPEDVQNEFELASQVLAGDKNGSIPGLDGDAHTKALTRSLLWKLDTRYAFVGDIVASCSPRFRLGSYRSLPSCSYVLSSTAQMWATPKSWVWRAMSASTTANMPTD